MQSNIKNRNGRVYPKEVLMKEVQKYLKRYSNVKRTWKKIMFKVSNQFSDDYGTFLKSK